MSPSTPLSSVSSFQAPTRLLQTLELDWESVGKRSVKDCLRTKAKICPQVKSVLQEQDSLLNQDELMRSFHSLKDTYMCWIQAVASSATEGDNRSPLWYLSRCATIIRFLELMLELEPESLQRNENMSPRCLLDESQVSKMTLELLRVLIVTTCQSIKSSDQPALRGGNDHPNDIYSRDIAEESPNASYVALFCLGSLIRLNNGHVRTKPFLFSPLWKGICELAQATKDIPNELTTAATRALVDHIQDGVDRLLANCESDSQKPDSDALGQLLFCTKVLSFLLVRLGAFLSFGLDATESLVVQVLQVIFLLTGIDDALVQQAVGTSSADHHPIEKAFKQISSKAEKSFTCWFWASPNNDDNLLEAAATSGSLSLLYQLSAAASKSDSPWKTDKFASVAFTFGKTRILIKALEDAKLRQTHSFWSSTDVNALLRIVEELLVRSLPLCWESTAVPGSSNTLLPRCISASVVILISCETQSPCVATNANPGRAPLHWLLTKWLSPQSDSACQHPINREAILTVLHLYAIGLCRVEGIDHVTPFLILLTKLLFDTRTATDLRRNIGACLSRMLRCSEKRLCRCLTSLLCEEQHSFVRCLSPSPLSRKRKRKQQSRMLETADLHIISSILSTSGPQDKDAMPSQFTVSLGNPAMLRARQLVFLAFQGIITSGPLSEDVVTKTIITFCELWASKQRKSDPRLADQLSLVGIAAAKQTYSICTEYNGNLSGDFLSAVCHLVELCSSDYLIAKCGQTVSTFISCLPLEAIRVLSAVGKAVSSTTQKRHLQRLTGSFKRLLSHADWMIRSYTMSSLVLFASTVPASHKSVLPACLPHDMQTLLQQRLQGSPAASPEHLSVLHRRASQILLKTIPLLNDKRGFAILMAPRSVLVATGSLVMHMPTQEGRRAVVIFPPGQQSLDDIHFMLGIDPDEGDEKPNVLEVRGSVVAKNGACKLLLV